MPNGGVSTYVSFELFNIYQFKGLKRTKNNFYPHFVDKGSTYVHCKDMLHSYSDTSWDFTKEIEEEKLEFKT